MSWFSSRGAGSRDRPDKHQGPAAPAPSGPQSHRSLGLASLLAGFSGRPRLQVLDLGPAVGGNVEFLSRFGCKLYIQDLYPALVPLQAAMTMLPAPGAATVATIDRAAVRAARETWEPRPSAQGGEHDDSGLAGRFDRLLPFPEHTRLGAGLVWDVF